MCCYIVAIPHEFNELSYLSTYLSIYIYLPNYLPTCLCLSISVYPSIYPTTYLYIICIQIRSTDIRVRGHNGEYTIIAIHAYVIWQVGSIRWNGQNVEHPAVPDLYGGLSRVACEAGSSSWPQPRLQSIETHR